MNTKKLITIALVILVLPLVSLMSQQCQDVVALDPPTVDFVDVETTADARIKVSVAVTLTDYSYDYHIKFVRLFLNQSAVTIESDNDDIYSTNNGTSATYSYDPDRGDTLETTVLSPVLTNGSNLDSAFYNITVVAVTNTDETGGLISWNSGAYYYLDVEKPFVDIVNPSVNYQEVWGTFPVQVNASDYSNISLIQFLIDGDEKHRIENPDPSQTIHTWNWYTTPYARTSFVLRVVVTDNCTVKSSADDSINVDVVGPKLSWVEPVPTTIDSNDTLYLNATATTQSSAYNISSVLLSYSINGSAYTNDSFSLLIDDNYYYNFSTTFGEDSEIEFFVYVINNASQYHIYYDTEQNPYSITVDHPDHILPVGEVIYEELYLEGETISVLFNITEQSPISSCTFTYKLNETEWQEEAMNLTATGPGADFYIYSYNFSSALPVFTLVTFNVQCNDSGGNELLLDNNGQNYTIRIAPLDQTAPNVTISLKPTSILNDVNFTITAKVNDSSAIRSIFVYYIVNDIQYVVEMTETTTDTYSATFSIKGVTGDDVEIWVRAEDIYYNTGDSEVLTYTIESQNPGPAHSNAWLWVIFIFLIILPVVLTILLLKPNK